MKKIFVISFALLFASNLLFAQNINDLVNAAANIVNRSSLTNDEIVKGLKEALKVGSDKSVSKASQVDGFLKNPSIKILFPPEAKAMETKLRSIGMGKQCDKFIETLNRGAEEASKSAVPIFVNAITQLSIGDGLKILNGSDNAATSYLKEQTTSQLKVAFTPVVKAALAKVKITNYWNPLATKYNKLPMVTKVNPNLEAYVTEKAIEGLFKLISEEEYKIRKDPGARVNDILKKVFGSK
jgi:hypothetical protein